MLSELYIKNFALVEDQHINFGTGLNVLSGETGAGKSIVLQAIQFLLGAKVKNSVIRAGADTTEVQGLFLLDKISDEIKRELPDIAVPEEGAELMVSRTLHQTGRSRVFVNGRLATLQILEELAVRLVNICGQNQQVRLLTPNYHLELIDSFGELEEDRSEYQSAFLKWKELKAEYEEYLSLSQKGDVRRAELEEIIQDLTPLKLKPGLRTELEADLKRLSQAERLIALGRNLEQELESAGSRVLQQLGSQVLEIQKLDPLFEPVADLFLSSKTQLQEFESDLSRYLSRLEVDEDTLEEIRERLSEIARLERKFKTNGEGLLSLLDSATRELAHSSGGANLDALKKEVEVSEQHFQKLGAKLSDARSKKARELSTAVEKELQELNMKGARLKVDISQISPGPSGLDKVEFLIAPNPGEAPGPLRHIASGGELSRILLVLKKVLRDRSGVNVLVFDEVDSGISGGVARAVGMKLKDLSLLSQVICITHLPQVASLADHHLLVDKQTGDRTISLIKEISGDQRIEEIARMLAGYKVTTAARESARELLSSKN